jgi:hypothetical protein
MVIDYDADDPTQHSIDFDYGMLVTTVSPKLHTIMKHMVSESPVVSEGSDGVDIGVLISSVDPDETFQKLKLSGFAENSQVHYMEEG